MHNGHDNADIEATQRVESTQVVATPHAQLDEEFGQTAEQNTIGGSIMSRGVDTQVLKAMFEQNGDAVDNTPMAWTRDHEMLGSQIEDRIQRPVSFECRSGDTSSINDYLITHKERQRGRT